MTADVPAEAVFSEFSGRLRAFIARRVRAPEDVDDLLQDVFLRIHRASDTLETAERPQAWLFRVTRNALVDHYRAAAARRRHTDAPLDEVPEPAAPPPSDEPRDEEELAGCLAPMLQQLPEPYREALKLTGLAAVPQVVAAERLGLSPSGMKSRVQRGRKLLRDALLRCCHVEFDRRGGVAGFQPKKASETCGGCGQEGS
jgi:RNA polymerase sigma-70 factor (ECF subfamily)